MPKATNLPMQNIQTFLMDYIIIFVELDDILTAESIYNALSSSTARYFVLFTIKHRILLFDWKVLGLIKFLN